MRSHLALVLIRWVLSPISVAAGWFMGLLAYLAIANASGRDQAVWATWTGGFRLAEWVLIGLPLALRGPDFSPAARAAAAVALCGAAGVLMIVLFFGSLAALFSPFSAPAFPAAPFSMLVYAILLRALPGTGPPPEAS